MNYSLDYDPFNRPLVMVKDPMNMPHFMSQKFHQSHLSIKMDQDPTVMPLIRINPPRIHHNS